MYSLTLTVIPHPGTPFMKIPFNRIKYIMPREMKINIAKVPLGEVILLRSI
jgi:hypothetical protein